MEYICVIIMKKMSSLKMQPKLGVDFSCLWQIILSLNWLSNNHDKRGIWNVSFTRLLGMKCKLTNNVFVWMNSSPIHFHKYSSIDLFRRTYKCISYIMIEIRPKYCYYLLVKSVIHGCCIIKVTMLFTKKSIKTCYLVTACNWKHSILFA